MHSLHPAGDSDKEAIFALYEELFRPHIHQIWGWTGEWQRENFEDEWLLSDNEVIEWHGGFAGYLQTQFRKDPDHLYLLSLAVRTQHQNRGIGTQVVKTLMDRAASRSLPICLNVFRTNPAALRFYSRFGFVHSGPSNSGSILKWIPSASWVRE